MKTLEESKTERDEGNPDGWKREANGSDRKTGFDSSVEQHVLGDFFCAQHEITESQT